MPLLRSRLKYHSKSMVVAPHLAARERVPLKSRGDVSIMPKAYTASPIRRDEVAAAYLLVETAGMQVDSGDWRVFCERVIEWRGATGLYDEVVLIKNRRDHIKGLFVTQPIQSLLFGRVMDVPVFISLSAGDDEGVFQVMLDAVRMRARQANCARIRVWTPGGQTWKRVADDMEFGSEFQGRDIPLGS